MNARPENKFTLDYQFDKDGDPTNAYCRSDHYMYARYGIPVAFFVAAAWYIDYHMVSDEPQYIAYDRMTHIGRYIRQYVGDVANLDHRPWSTSRSRTRTGCVVSDGGHSMRLVILRCAQVTRGA